MAAPGECGRLPLEVNCNEVYKLLAETNEIDSSDLTKEAYIAV